MFFRFKPLAAFIMLVFFLCSSCEEKGNDIQWYYWKQDFNLNVQQKQLLDTLKTGKVYTKFFDIDYVDGETVPLALIQFETKLDSVDIIPCIYITNRTFDDNKRIATHIFDAEVLAKKVFDLVKQISGKNRLPKYQEIQFDCDWTGSTKDNYFVFLEAFKRLTGDDVLVTSTLRLHQLKYPKETGVPPVEKVCLMVYNVGNIKDPNETNSIFRPDIVEDYLQTSTKYPLPMDIALPVYSWAVLYRFEKLSLIFNNMSLERLQKNQSLKQEGENIFRSLNDHYFEGNYLYKNDLIRLEVISVESLLSVSPLFKGIQSNETQLILFDLSNENSLNYTYEDFQNIRDTFY